MKENTESLYDDEEDNGEILASARFMANELGFRVMHRRNGQYWLMFAEPMTIYEIDHFFTTGFKVMNGEPGHFQFEPVPDNAWRRANKWGKPGSKPLAKGGRK
jgi:hypothetical protein